MASEGMFQLDADGDAVSSEVSDPVASGTITPTSVRAKSEVELSRKAIPLLEVEKDVCRWVWAAARVGHDWHVASAPPGPAAQQRAFGDSLMRRLVAASA